MQEISAATRCRIPARAGINKAIQQLDQVIKPKHPLGRNASLPGDGGSAERLQHSIAFFRISVTRGTSSSSLLPSETVKKAKVAQIPQPVRGSSCDEKVANASGTMLDLGDDRVDNDFARF